MMADLDYNCPESGHVLQWDTLTDGPYYATKVCPTYGWCAFCSKRFLLLNLKKPKTSTPIVTSTPPSPPTKKSVRLTKFQWFILVMNMVSAGFAIAFAIPTLSSGLLMLAGDIPLVGGWFASLTISDWMEAQIGLTVILDIAYGFTCAGF